MALSFMLRLFLLSVAAARRRRRCCFKPENKSSGAVRPSLTRALVFVQFTSTTAQVSQLFALSATATTTTTTTNNGSHQADCPQIVSSSIPTLSLLEPFD